MQQVQHTGHIQDIVQVEQHQTIEQPQHQIGCIWDYPNGQLRLILRTATMCSIFTSTAA